MTTIEPHHTAVEVRVHGIGNHDSFSALGSAPIVGVTTDSVTLAGAPILPRQPLILVDWSRTTRKNLHLLWYIAFPFTLVNVAGYMRPPTAAKWSSRFLGTAVFFTGLLLTACSVAWLVAIGETIFRYVPLGLLTGVDLDRVIVLVSVAIICMSMIARHYFRPQSRVRISLLIYHILTAIVVGLSLAILRPSRWLTTLWPSVETPSFIGVWRSELAPGPWRTPEDEIVQIGELSRHGELDASHVDPQITLRPDAMTVTVVLSLLIVLLFAIVLVTLDILGTARSKKAGERPTHGLAGAALTLLLAMILLHTFASILRIGLTRIFSYFLGQWRLDFDSLKWFDRSLLPFDSSRSVIDSRIDLIPFFAVVSLLLFAVSATITAGPFNGAGLYRTKWIPLKIRVPIYIVAFVTIVVAFPWPSSLVTAGVITLLYIAFSVIARIILPGVSPDSIPASRAIWVHKFIEGFGARLFVSLPVALVLTGSAFFIIRQFRFELIHSSYWLVLQSLLYIGIIIVIGFLLSGQPAPVAAVMGMIADIAGFWSVSYHPLAGISYRHAVIFGISEAVENSEVDEVVLVGHSQGSVLCAWYMSLDQTQLDMETAQGRAQDNGPAGRRKTSDYIAAAVPESGERTSEEYGENTFNKPGGGNATATPTRPPVRLVTCGSPLYSLYEVFFPRWFGPPFIERVKETTASWRNFWRQTDPIANAFVQLYDFDVETGQPAPSIPAGKNTNHQLADPAEPGQEPRVHSDYWIEQAQIHYIAEVLALTQPDKPEPDAPGPT